MKQTAQELRTLADSYSGKIQAAFSAPTQNMTPKRQLQQDQRRIQGWLFERVQKTLHRLADMMEQPALGPIPSEVASLKLTKALLERRLRTRLEYPGYYLVHDTGKFTDGTLVGKAFQAVFAAAGKTPEDLEKERARALTALEESVRLDPIPGFFPTPPEIIDCMLATSRFRSDMVILEPSAGKGDIAQAIKDATGIVPHCCEIVPKLRSILQAKGLIPGSQQEARSPFDGATDFLAEPATPMFDLVLMNPPFEKDAWIDHFKHAIKCLSGVGQENAQVVCVAPAWMTQRLDAARKNRQDLLDMRDAGRLMVLEHSGDFTDAFRRTGVSTCLVIGWRSE